jgi:hypothetical protein
MYCMSSLMATNPSTPNQATLGFLKVFFDALPQA